MPISRLASTSVPLRGVPAYGSHDALGAAAGPAPGSPLQLAATAGGHQRSGSFSELAAEARDPGLTDEQLALGQALVAEAQAASSTRHAASNGAAQHGSGSDQEGSESPSHAHERRELLIYALPLTREKVCRLGGQGAGAYCLARPCMRTSRMPPPTGTCKETLHRMPAVPDRLLACGPMVPRAAARAAAAAATGHRRRGLCPVSCGGSPGRGGRGVEQHEGGGGGHAEKPPVQVGERLAAAADSKRAKVLLLHLPAVGVHNDVCVWVGGGEGLPACVYACECACVRASARARVRVCVWGGGAGAWNTTAMPDACTHTHTHTHTRQVHKHPPPPCLAIACPRRASACWTALALRSGSCVRCQRAFRG